jgi:hypothetical protein
MTRSATIAGVRYAANVADGASAVQNGFDDRVLGHSITVTNVLTVLAIGAVSSNAGMIRHDPNAG